MAAQLAVRTGLGLLCGGAALCIATAAIALPAEDHWSSDMEPALAKALEDATARIDSGAYADAIAALKPLADQLPSNADVFNLLGYAHRKTGNLRRSAPYYERALYLNPDHLGALAYQGELFLAQDNPDGAAANLRRLEKLCDLPCDARETLAGALRQWRARQTN